MNPRLNKLLIGVIILLIGIASLFGRYIGISYSMVTLIFSGLCFLLLYKTKGKIWSLALGCFLSYIGVMQLLAYFGLSALAPKGAAAMFFIIPGVIFLVLYHDRNKRSLLLPGMMFIWFGIYILINDNWIIRLININGGALFFLCAGAGLLCASAAGRDFLPKSVHIFGIAGVVMGIFLMFSISDYFAPLIMLISIPWLPPCLLIAAALLFIIRQIFNK